MFQSQMNKRKSRKEMAQSESPWTERVMLGKLGLGDLGDTQLVSKQKLTSKFKMKVRKQLKNRC